MDQSSFPATFKVVISESVQITDTAATITSSILGTPLVELELQDDLGTESWELSTFVSVNSRGNGGKDDMSNHL
jgi:hypothetical protein